ncbi:putative PEP-CTERM system TPR-repeat lipoprotein [Nitrosospira multiformis]|nr:putative PEP-CTERM system TPR-repeat lipoprotein [Nitrosospira multiformis]
MKVDLVADSEKGIYMRAFRKTVLKKTGLTLAIAAALTAGSMQGCNKAVDPVKLMADAKRYEESGDHKSAIIQLKNALQQNPDNSEARYLLGAIYNKTGDFQSAEKELRKALSLGMDAGKVLPELGQALLRLGAYQQILDETKELADKTKSAQILTLRGNAQLGLGKTAEAKALFEQALGHNPDSADALIGLAKYSLVQRDVEGATHFSEQAVSRSPQNVEAWLFRGDLLRMQGKSGEALAAYDQVVKLKPNAAIAYINKAFIEIGTGKFEAAKADIDAARKISPSLMVFYTQALLDFSQQKPAAALESLQQVLSKSPDHMPSVLLAGAVQFALGSMPQAEQHLKHYLEKDPGNIYARKLLASALLKNGETKRAIDILTPPLKNVKEDPQLFALAGEAYMQAKDFAKATEYFEMASDIAPRSAMLHTALSMSRLGQGENARAISELETATKLDPKSPRAGVLLVMTHLRLKEFDKALAAVKALEKENPDNPLIQNLKGGVYLGKNDIANARASFEKALAIQPNYFPTIANLARLDIQDKKPDAARKRFEAILEKDKKNIQAMVALAGLAVNQGQNQKATEWLERAMQANPDVLQPAILLGTHYLRLGEKQKALALAKKLEGTHSKDSAVLDLLAQAQLANNDKSSALESYARLAVVQPESPLVQFRIASIHMAMRNLSAASDALKKSLAIKPDYLAAQLAQIDIEAEQGNYEKAIAMARQVQKQHKGSPAGYIAEGDLLLKQKKPALAASAYEQAFAVNKTSPLLIKLHASLRQAGKDKEADLRLIEWLKKHPNDLSARMYLADTFLTEGKLAAAVEQYQTVLKEQPKFAPALNNLATAYQRQKDPRALEYAEKAYQLATENPAVLDTLGWVLLEQENIARALPLLQKAASLAPQAGEIRYHFASALVKSGNKSQARKELEQILATGKTFSGIDEARALLERIQ